MDDARTVSRSRVIPAPAAERFAVLAHTDGHVAIDGSDTLNSSIESKPLGPGVTFAMKMHAGPIPYRITNTVVEWEPDQLIAWRHFGRHRWRWELREVDDGTEVTETFDWSGALSPRVLEWMGYPKRHPPAMEATLERLEAEVMRRRGTTD